MLKRPQTVRCLKKCCVLVSSSNCSVAKCTVGASELTGLCDSFLYIAPNFMSDCRVTWALTAWWVFGECYDGYVRWIASPQCLPSEQQEQFNGHVSCKMNVFYGIQPVGLCAHLSSVSLYDVLPFPMMPYRQMNQNTCTGVLSHNSNLWLSDVTCWWVMNWVTVPLKIYRIHCHCDYIYVLCRKSNDGNMLFPLCFEFMQAPMSVVLPASCKECFAL